MGSAPPPSFSANFMLNVPTISLGARELAILTSAIAAGLSAAGSAASWAASSLGSLFSAGGVAGAAGAAAPSTFATAAGAIPAAVAVTPAVPLGATVGAAAAETAAAATGTSLATKLATAAALGSAGAGLIQATKGMPDVPRPTPPPPPPTLADPTVQAAGFNQRARAAAKGGMGFGNTVTNKGGAQGIPFGSTPSLLASSSLLG